MACGGASHQLPMGLMSLTDNSCFHVDTVVSDDVVTIRIHGDLDMDTAPRLFAHVIAQGTVGQLVVDLSACPFIDSSGMTGLLACRQQLDPTSTMRLVGVTPNVTRTLQMCGVLGLLSDR